MKKFILPTVCALFMISCSPKYVSHGAVKPVGRKSYRESQKILDASFPGRSFLRPNKFQKSHF